MDHLTPTGDGHPLYRFYGRTSRSEATLLGACWSPARPSLAIDQLGYEPWHDRSRADLAIKRVEPDEGGY